MKSDDKKSTPITDLVDKRYRGFSARELAKAPVDTLKGVSPTDARKLLEALRIHTIEDLASSPFVQAAQSIRDAAESAPVAFSASAAEMPLEARAEAVPEGDTASFLSSARYGYDFVVATTQQSINATMKEYLDVVGQPEVIQCWLMDDNGNPQAIDYNDLLKQSGNVDPFSIPDNAGADDSRVKALSDLGFWYGFKASVGNPPGYAPDAIPDIVTLGTDTSAVRFSMMCSEFRVVQAKYGRRGIMGWLNRSQPDGNAWIFRSDVDMRLTQYGGTNFSQLPQPVQDAIKNLGGDAFSIEQLLFDLQNARLSTIPTIDGLVAGDPALVALQTSFLGAYFGTLRKTGEPVLGYTVKRRDAINTSSLKLTDLNFNVNPYVGTNGQPIAQPTDEQRNLATLNYLCAANAHELPPATKFAWNWVDTSQSRDIDGVAAINRNALRDWLEPRITPAIRQYCFEPYARTTSNFFTTHFEASVMHGLGSPTVTKPDSGATVLQYTYSQSAYDEAGANGSLARLKIAVTVSANVQFQGNQITITQRLTIYTMVRNLATEASGNAVDKTVVNTYTLSVDQRGRLAVTPQNSANDVGETPSANGFLNFWANVNDFSTMVADAAKQCASLNMGDIPVNAVQDFVFPGAKTFTYKNVQFSDNQDLISHITYVSPS